MKTLNHVIGSKIEITEDLKRIIDRSSARISYSKYYEGFLNYSVEAGDGQFMVALSDGMSNDVNDWYSVGRYSTEEECLKAIKEWRRAIKKQCNIAMNVKRYSSTSGKPIWFKGATV